MSKVKLSPRLRALAERLPAGRVLADVGTDHAYLPIYAVGEGIAPRAIATDLRPGPAAAAREQVRLAGLSGLIEVRVGDGLEVLRPGEAGVAAVAGLGGTTIAGILARGMDRARACERLLLQPMNAAGALRGYLLEAGFALVDDLLVEEGGRIYPVLAADPRTAAVADLPVDLTPAAVLQAATRLAPAGWGFPPGTPRDLALEVGPLPWSRRDPLLLPYLAAELVECRRLLGAVARSSAPAAAARRAWFQRRLEGLEAMRQCWPR